MIKIVKHKPKFYFTKCYKCDCELQYELDDLKFDMDQMTLVVKCPECGAVIPHNNRERDYKEVN